MEENAGLDIFICVLLKHPEFNAIKYDAVNGEIKIEVALQGEMDGESQEGFITEAQKCIGFFHQIAMIKTSIMKIKFEKYHASNLTFLRYYRDVETLTEGEVEIFASLLQKCFNEFIIRDSGKIITEDVYKKRIKENLLYKINREKTSTSNFLAYREHGRVLVFNK